METTLNHPSNDISTFDQLQNRIEDFWLLIKASLTGDLGKRKNNQRNKNVKQQVNHWGD